MGHTFSLHCLAGSERRRPPSFPILWSILLLLGFVIHSRPLRGQGEEPSFEHLTIDDGLSQNLIFSILQDYRGFMWFGTNDGLNRYDGYEFWIYNQVPGDSVSLNDNSVTILYEDSRRNLWVGAGGLNRYDRQYDRFERILTGEDLPGTPAVPELKAIAEDPNGDLWVVIHSVGLFRLEFHTSPENSGAGANSFSNYELVGPYLLDYDRELSSEDYGFQAIVFVGNDLWVSYAGGVARLPADPRGRFPEPEQSGFESISFGFPGESSQFRSLFLAPDQSLWIGTQFGLIYLADPSRPEAFSHYPYQAGLFDIPWEGIIKKIILAPSGNLWLATYGGVLIFDPQTKKYKKVKHDPQDAKSLSFGNVSDIFLDDGQVIWLGTVGKGINKYIANPKPFTHYLGTMEHKTIYSVYDVLDDSHGGVWAAINTGQLYHFDRNSGILERANPEKLKEWEINCMVRDQNDVLWMSNSNILTRFDPASGQMDNYEIMPKLSYNFPSDSISMLYIDDAGQLWACNSRSLRRFDPAAGSFVSYLLPNLNLEIVQDLYRDKSGDFWIATLTGLLHFQVNKGHGELYQATPGNPDSLQHNRVKCILPDPGAPERYLWIGTGGGLYRLDVGRRIFKRYTRADGLPNEFIYGILPDDSGRLWMSTNHGLSCYDPGSGEFTNYSVEDGLQSNEFNSRAYYRSQSGEFFFGGVNGLTVFWPEAIVPNPHLPTVVLTDMELSYKSVRPGDPKAPLEYSITEAKEVHLAYHQNNIAFKFTALDFTLPEANQYRYMLEGFDPDWIEAGNERRATYTNLPPGDYTLRVMGANNDGIWNEEDTSLRIFISPPLWKTWWAYLAYILIVGAILYGAYRQINTQSRIREELRIKALESQQLAELDQFKSQFFANISHEFRTPITLIQARIEELLGEFSRNDVKEKLYSMSRNSRQLMRLIEQLLDIARLEARKMSLKNSDGDIVEFVRILINSLHSGAHAHDISLSYTADPAHCFVAFDRDALQKILQNLISNAIKYSRPGGEVEVTLNAQEQSPDAVAVQITVADEGIGIAEADLPHIFDRFFQSEGGAVLPDQGFGLGLALVKELVDLHRGTISAQSIEGEGTMFKVCLPLPPAAGPAPSIVLDQRLLEMESAELERQVLGVPGEAGVLRNWNRPLGKTLLLVEDHDELRAYISGIFHTGFKVIEASDGREGLEKAFEKLPDLIIADVMMPRMDGFELCRLLKTDQRTSHIPVILLTAKAETADRVKGLETGADDYLVKPFSEEELSLRVANLIRSRETLKKKYAKSLLAGVTETEKPTQEEWFLESVRKSIESNLADENFGVEVLAKEMKMSPSQLYRKLRALVDMSPVQLIQRLRLERAAALLKQGHNVSEVAYQVGLRSPGYFSQLFKKYFGCTPKEYGGAADN